MLLQVTCPETPSLGTGKDDWSHKEEALSPVTMRCGGSVWRGNSGQRITDGFQLSVAPENFQISSTAQGYCWQWLNCFPKSPDGSFVFLCSSLGLQSLQIRHRWCITAVFNKQRGGWMLCNVFPQPIHYLKVNSSASDGVCWAISVSRWVWGQVFLSSDNILQEVILGRDAMLGNAHSLARLWYGVDVHPLLDPHSLHPAARTSYCNGGWGAWEGDSHNFIHKAGANNSNKWRCANLLDLCAL